MEGTLIRTKLNVPSTRLLLVPRPDLIERLNAAGRSRVTLLSAPAGYGKTTLLSAWAQQCSLPVAWLALEESDNDLARFLTYLAAAFQVLLSDLETAPSLTPESVIGHFVNEFVASKAAGVLVLDDYHAIRSAAIHDSLTFLIDHQPPALHLAIASRADPPLPLARLRARGQLTELRQQDLQFNAAEAARFLNQVMGLDLSAANVAALNRRAEGWIAGLQMAAVSLAGRADANDAQRFIDSFTGTHRYILDYLVEEVLNRQPPPVQRFLLQTAVLDRFCASLADEMQDAGLQTAAAEKYDSQETLVYLESRNLFIIPLDDERRWYRYHRLFADLLRRRLRQQEAHQLPLLHRNASRWFAKQDLLPEAIDHALAAADHTQATTLIEQVAETTLMRSENSTLLGWIDRLPPEVVEKRPLLALYHAWALLLTGRSLDDVNAFIRRLDANEMESHLAVMKAFVALSQGQISVTDALSRQVLQTVSEEETFQRGLAAWMLSITSEATGGDELADNPLTANVQRSLAAGHTLIAVVSLCHVGQQQRRRGHMEEARKLLREALDLATDSFGNRLPVAGEALMGLGEVAMEKNELDEAEALLTEGIDLILQWRSVAALPGYLRLAFIQESRGNYAAADLVLEKAREAAVAFAPMTWDDYLVELYQARSWIKRGNLAAAQAWFDEQEKLPEPPDPPQTDEDLLMERLLRYQKSILARLRLAQRRPQQALALLSRLLPDMQQSGRIDTLIENYLLQALAYQMLGDVDAGFKMLTKALELGSASGFLRLFLDDAERLVPLLQTAVSRQICPHFAGQILQAFAQSALTQVPPLDPLTSRELDVLEEIAAGLTNQEIANKLFISLSTVKGHTTNIYSKLGVANRTQAIAQARTLGILS